MARQIIDFDRPIVSIRVTWTTLAPKKGRLGYVETKHSAQCATLEEAVEIAALDPAKRWIEVRYEGMKVHRKVGGPESVRAALAEAGR